MRRFVFILLTCLFLPSLWGFTRPSQSHHTEVELVSETTSLAPGQTGWLALRMKMDPHWHIYWVNPGEFGEITKVEWNHVPTGIEIGDFRWPAPHLYEQSGIINYVYEGEVFLLFPITVSDEFRGDALALNGSVTWLECDENACVPGKGTVSLNLPVKPGDPAPSKWAPKFEKTRQQWPQDLSAHWGITARDTGKNGFDLTLTPREGANPAPKDVYFFAREAVTAPAQPQSFTRNDDGSFSLKVARSEYAPDSVTELSGVLKSSNGWLADGGPADMTVNVELDASGKAGTSAAISDASGNAASQTPLGVLLGFAFVGGLILNLMPCVFPVLGLKIMSFVKQGGESQGRIFAHGLVYTLGVLISFWALAAVLLVLRAGGEQLGWGFQLQSTGFVLAMTVVVLAFGLNMSGIFEVGMSAVGVGSGLTAKPGLSGSFFSGVLATLVATPLRRAPSSLPRWEPPSPFRPCSRYCFSP